MSGDAPALTRRLDLEERQLTPDGSGGFETAWIKLGTLPAAVEARSARESYLGPRTQARVSYRITVRAAPVGAPSRPKTDQRFRDGARIYDILGVAESAESRLYLECWASEGDGT